MPDPLAILYKVTKEKELFGEAYCFEGKAMPQNEWTHIATYQEDCDGTLGPLVKVWCLALPSRFYRLNVFSLGDDPAYSLATGSGMGKWAAETAKQISEGMVALEHGRIPKLRDGEDNAVLEVREPEERKQGVNLC